MRSTRLNPPVGAVHGDDPKIIFVTMIQRVDRYPEGSEMANICILRAKFNDLLNDAAARNDHFILSVRGLNGPQYFDKYGNLSSKGQKAFWLEIDELIDKFSKNKVKLKPKAIKNALNRKKTTSKQRYYHKQRSSHSHYQRHSAPRGHRSANDTTSPSTRHSRSHSRY